MKSIYNEAIRLKYSGFSYKQISIKLKGKLSENTLKEYFSLDGLLYVPYLEFETKQNEWNLENTRNEFKKLATKSSKALQDLLKKAMDKNDLRLAFDIVKEINSIAGLTALNKQEIQDKNNKKETITTYEEFRAELIKSDIDPDTGFRIKKFN